jgi:hypothetical protein
MSASSHPAVRDQRLDFWRGLCLIDMLLVHLVWNAKVQFGSFFHDFFGSYTRFAAGGFIFVSGLSIGVIFWPRAADPKRRPKTYRALWRRSLYILVVNYMCAMVAIIIDVLTGARGASINPLALLRDIILLREGGDLLPFYVMMIALSPILMMLLRFSRGWLFVLIGSVSLFAWGLWHPWALAPAQHDVFAPVLWQMVFILGLLLGWAWPKYNALSQKWKITLAAASTLMACILFVMEYSYLWDMKYLSFGIAFVKTPLSTPEALRYLSITFALISTTDLLWPWLRDTSAAAFVQTLGKKSLPVYVLHLWVVEGIAYLVLKTPNMGAWQSIYALVSLLILWLFALILDVYKTPKSARQPQRAQSIPALFTTAQ